MRPPDIKDTWNDNDIWAQAHLIAYDQIRGYEEQERDNNFYKVLGAR